jgi:hypothetical protein
MLTGPIVLGFMSDDPGIDSVFFLSAGVALASGLLA